MLFNKHTFTQPKESKCPCACHDNILKKPYGHDTKCCDEMNGYMESEEKEEWPCVRGNTCRMLECKPDDWDIRGKIAGIVKTLKDKDLPPLPEELELNDKWTIKQVFSQLESLRQYLKARE